MHKFTKEERIRSRISYAKKCKEREYKVPFECLGKKVRRRVIREEQEGKCVSCGLSEWKSKPIVLEIHHINGNKKDNRRENQEGLCPNCHSLTPGWRGKSS